MPRSTVTPTVGARMTEPANVAFTVLDIVRFWAVIETVPLPVIVPSVKEEISTTVRFVPLATTVLKSLVALFSVILPLVPVPPDMKLAVPETDRLPPDWVIVPPEISVRPVPSVALVRVIAAVFTIAAELLLIVSVPAVILLISVLLRPRLDEESGPPRSTPAPSVWIVTLPDVVAFIVPIRMMLLALSVIGPPFEEIRPSALSKYIPNPDWFAVTPVIMTLPGPVDETFAALCR